MRAYLVKLRKGKNWTVRETAKRMQLSPGAYHNIEVGIRQTDMTLSTMQKIAETFNLTTDAVVTMEARYQESRA